MTPGPHGAAVRHNPGMDDDLISICDVCREPIADGKGRLWVDYAAINQRQDAVRAWEERTAPEDGGVRLVGFMTMYEYPGPVRWNAHHSACDPDPDAGAYPVEVERIRTWADLTHWTAHLMEHKWFSGTDWNKVLVGVSDGTGTRLRPVRPSRLNA